MQPTTTPLTAQQIFNQAYNLHWPVATQALMKMNQGAARESQAAALAQAGYSIDLEIMAWGGDPWVVMGIRLQFGQTWEPTALQLPLGAPNGYALPNEPIESGQTPYPVAPPPGSLIVSQNPADFLPFAPVVPPAPVPVSTDPVGMHIIGNIYAPSPGDTTPVGQEVMDSRGTFMKVSGQEPMGPVTYYLLVNGAAVQA